MCTDPRLQSGRVQSSKLQRPLCRGYRIVVLAEAEVSVRFDDGQLPLRFDWALGFQPNTEAEVLGLWCQPDGSVDLAGDLRERGLERVAFVVDGGRRGAAEAVLAAYPRARVAPSTERFVRCVSGPLRRQLRAAASADLRAAFSGGGRGALRDAVNAVPVPVVDQQAARLDVALGLQASLAALSEQDRRFVLAADRTVTVLLEELSRAVRLNGYFLNQDAAVAFVMKTLLGAERRMDRERAALAAHFRTLRAVVADGVAEAQAA